MEGVLAKNFPYYSGAAAQVVTGSFFYFYLICAIIAFLQLLAEWLYLGRPARKISFSLLAALLVIGLIGDHWIQPKLKALHETRYSVNAQPATRDLAAKSFKGWTIAARLLDLCAIGGLVIYVWRMANPPDTFRYVGSVKFRGDR